MAHEISTSDTALVVCDVDETLIDHSDAESSDTIAVASLVKRMNVPFTLATGRSFSQVRQLVELFDITLPVIVDNGAAVVSADTVLMNHTLQAEPMLKLLHELDAAGLTIIASDVHHDYYLRPTAYIHRERIDDYCLPLSTRGADEDRLQHLNKILIVDGEETLGKRIEYVKRCFEQLTATVISYGTHAFDVMPKDVDKSIGIEWLRNNAGQERPIIAIGNAPNDIGMIQSADMGIAVGNASQRLKAVADYVCSGSFSAGVIEALSCAVR